MMYAPDASSDAVGHRLDFTKKLIGTIAPVRQREALQRWLEVAEKGRVTRKELTPAMFGRTLQFVVLVDVLDGGKDYRHVIEGREVIRWFGKAGDTPFSALYAPQHFAQLKSFYLTVLMTGRPNVRHFMVHSLRDEELAYSQLVLPAVNEEGVVTRLAVVFDFPDPFRRIPDGPLRMFSTWWQMQKGGASETILGDHNWR